MKTLVKLFCLFFLLSISSYFVLGVGSVTLTIYPEGEELVGYKFLDNDFTSSDDADIYAKESVIGESSSIAFFANKQSFKNMGKEYLDEFRCDDIPLDDYVFETVIYERQGYCVLTYDRDELIKIYVDLVPEEGNTVNIEWIINGMEVEEEEEEVEEIVEVEEEDGEGGIAIPEEGEGDINVEEEDEESLLVDEKETVLTKFIEDFKKNPFLFSIMFIILILALISVLFLWLNKRKNE